MALWSPDRLDLCGPASITLDGEGQGEFAFGAFVASLDVAATPGGVDFTWEGCDDGTEVCGDGWADLEEDGSLTGEFAYRNGDESTFRAVPFACGRNSRRR